MEARMRQHDRSTPTEAVRIALACAVTVVAALGAFPGCERAEPDEGAPAASSATGSPAAAGPAGSERAREGSDPARAAEAPPPAGPIPEPWVRQRARDAEARLAETEAGRLLWKAIDAHGGLAPWLAAGTIEFEFDYRPLGEPERRMHTLNQVDLWRSRAYQKQIGSKTEARFGFDGNVAWIVPSPDAFPTPARFWATTPYYFVGIPWVLADPGTRHELLDDASLHGTTYNLVKVTYESGTGDSPDDYYVVYIHPETHTVDAIRYIVSYPGFFPEGGHSPEKLMTYEKRKVVQGLRIAHRYRAFPFDPTQDELGDPVTEVEIAKVRFGERWPGRRFTPPENAHVDRSAPGAER
jgi:hypothetical protein